MLVHRLFILLLLNFSLFCGRSQNYRPIFHFSPPNNWTNDPNGLVYYNGEYHLFYQYNPFSDTWGHMSWGHAKSRDMMKWTHLPVAIPEIKLGNNKTAMIFSGTAVADKTNTSGFGTLQNKSPLVAIYTAHIDSAGNGLRQYQSLAYSLDGVHFTQYQNNPVLDIGLKDFRDPKIFWYEPGKKWVMIVAKPLEFSVQFYSSQDLRSWTFLSEFSDSHGDKSKIWECPDFFELPVENQKGNSKWVITLSGGHPQKSNFLGMQYFIGDFDGTTFRADRLNYPLYLDNGKVFYAGIIFNNFPPSDKRKIMIGWTNCWVYANDIPSSGYRGQMSVPRELHLYKSTMGEYRLRSFPAAEVNHYRAEALFSSPAIIVKGTYPLKTVKGAALDISFIVAKGPADQAGIRILKNGKQQTVIYYDKEDNTLKLDRTASGKVDFHERFASVESVEIAENNREVEIRILVDRNIVEVFANRGKHVITDLVFPETEDVTAEFFSSGSAVQFKDVEIRRMRAAR
jgi:fructan beta-fructosidase